MLVWGMLRCEPRGEQRQDRGGKGGGSSPYPPPPPHHCHGCLPACRIPDKLTQLPTQGCISSQTSPLPHRPRRAPPPHTHFSPAVRGLWSSRGRIDPSGSKASPAPAAGRILTKDEGSELYAATAVATTDATAVATAVAAAVATAVAFRRYWRRRLRHPSATSNKQRQIPSPLCP